MKRFAWRLQSVLDVKTREEQARRVELFQLTERLAETRTRLLTRRRILNDIIRSISAREPRQRLGQQEFFLKYSGTNDAEIRRLKNEINELETRQKEKITQLLETRRFKEGLEKLRTEAKEEFIREQEKLEQRALDEGATISTARKRYPIAR
jgi:flagellar biosynthesis chaperone FliJ